MEDKKDSVYEGNLYISDDSKKIYVNFVLPLVEPVGLEMVAELHPDVGTDEDDKVLGINMLAFIRSMITLQPRLSGVFRCKMVSYQNLRIGSVCEIHIYYVENEKETISIKAKVEEVRRATEDEMKRGFPYRC